MDLHTRNFFHQSSDEAPQSNFHTVIALHDAPDISWEAAQEKVPSFPRGWYELSRLNAKDRIEFTRDFWLSKLPYRQTLDQLIFRFFASLDDIGIFITQKKYDDPYEVTLVYSLKEEKGFFRGAVPLTEEKLLKLKKSFSDYIFPCDYIAFLQIHDGFWKTTDCTGLYSSELMPEAYKNLQKIVTEREPIITSTDALVNPKTLIPFYESFGMPFFQCFWAEWYPEEEMGNVYYSNQSQTISDTYGKAGIETMAFPTFTDWLMFYLERTV